MPPFSPLILLLSPLTPPFFTFTSASSTLSMCPLVFLVSSRRGSGFKHQHMTVTLLARSASHSSKVLVDCRDTRLVSAFEGLAIRGGYCNVPLHHMTIRLAHPTHATTFLYTSATFLCASAPFCALPLIAHFLALRQTSDHPCKLRTICAFLIYPFPHVSCHFHMCFTLFRLCLLSYCSGTYGT
jgi:hypothetical protein